MSETVDKKPAVRSDGDAPEDVIKVTLAQPGHGEPITVRAKSSTLVSKLIDAFARNQNIAANTIRLVTAEGERMRPQQKLGDYNIENDDRLDVLIEQTGGR